jgi:endoglucanase
MKKILIIVTSSLLAFSCVKKTDTWIRINQIGYRPGDIKIAVLISNVEKSISAFSVYDINGKTVLTSDKIVSAPALGQFKTCYRLDLSELVEPGNYNISAGNAVSPDFSIGDDVYSGAAEYLLNYMRQQRCGFNPFLRDSCHVQDGYEVYGKGDSAHIDVTGGWHDAADYLQYVATSANAVYQMMFAWLENPAAFSDEYLANGLPGKDGIADVLNESRWGLDWLLKMNPRDEVMYNQIADDRDHIGFRLPVGDSADYGKGTMRPVYRCTGTPQGLFKYTNRSTGIASTAGKFASAFAIGSKVYSQSDPSFSAMLLKKAEAAFRYGLKHPGVCQTAPGRAPYFYEEDNWTDDMELAAAELYNLTGGRQYLEKAIEFGRQERVTPWMGADTARHYQWYPFVNMGHPVIARHYNEAEGQEAAGFMKEGLERIKQKASGNPFKIGVPFIWCSNNLVAAFLTQARLYSEITGDGSYAELEASHRDWLFGCNPWGTSMIVGLPQHGDYPENTHSSYVVRGDQVWGGLVDGPVYPSIFNAHSRYVSLQGEDQYARFQTSMAVYHDDIGDYTSNECTMDGTACMFYYLSEMEKPNPIP